MCLFSIASVYVEVYLYTLCCAPCEPSDELAVALQVSCRLSHQWVIQCYDADNTRAADAYKRRHRSGVYWSWAVPTLGAERISSSNLHMLTC